ncbi:hypothetical protein KIH39_16990 [Telmatocola sphagniphila]|jgi:hypothetical protein|uniref:Uncharacterized protein n=1 Tax=Telmatocola sphagniphila TaxID=1123043 RepID=A0A8E6B2K3_9BACT|nr:hypothetical protein [Telmatocola sphagniphila]QVL30541.1 hypothetical protein KIH39_16990 [Telmatocola sphagniphila]
MLFAQQVDQVAKKLESAAQDPEYLTYIGIAVAVILVIVVLVKFFGGPRTPPDLESGLRENLKEFPPPPAAGQRTLIFNGLETRIRLIVVAPQGKQKQTITAQDVPNLMGDLLRGLQSVVKSDKPRIKVWPTQLSIDGFAPTFHRLVASPDADKAKSKWIRIAGPVKIGGINYLVGMALWSAEATKIGKVIMQPTSWGSDLSIEG